MSLSILLIFFLRRFNCLAVVLRFIYFYPKPPTALPVEWIVVWLSLSKQLGNASSVIISCAEKPGKESAHPFSLPAGVHENRGK